MIEEVYVRILEDWNWSPSQICVGLRADFRCEYCERDLLANVYDYDAFNIDHILPASPQIDEQWNLALSCKFCNYLKGKRLLFGDFHPEINRELAIEAIRVALGPLREKKQQTLDDLRKHFRRP